MKSTITVEINLPQAEVAELFTNPQHTTRWMHDVDRYFPIPRRNENATDLS